MNDFCWIRTSVPWTSDDLICYLVPKLKTFCLFAFCHDEREIGFSTLDENSLTLIVSLIDDADCKCLVFIYHHSYSMEIGTSLITYVLRQSRRSMLS